MKKVVYWWKLSMMKVVNDESCLLMKVVYWWNLSIGENCLLMKIVYWWNLSIGENCLLMKIVYWWKLSIDESCQLTKVVYWRKLSIDENFLLMKVKIVKEVIASDVSPVAMFSAVTICRNKTWKIHTNDSLPRYWLPYNIILCFHTKIHFGRRRKSFSLSLGSPWHLIWNRIHSSL